MRVFRCHRIGQTRDVKIHRLLCWGTIEENIFLKQLQKRMLDSIVMDRGQFTKSNIGTKVLTADRLQGVAGTLARRCEGGLLQLCASNDILSLLISPPSSLSLYLSPLLPSLFISHPFFPLSLSLTPSSLSLYLSHLLPSLFISHPFFPLSLSLTPSSLSLYLSPLLPSLFGWKILQP